MFQIEIRKVRIEDVEELQTISRQTFYETFSAENTEENMRNYLEQQLSIERLLSELNANSEFYFAIYSNRIIGYIKLNFGESQTEIKNTNAIEIERIYVLKEFQGKAVGQVLYQKAIQIAEELKATYIWLGVWEKNEKAIRFYKKNGFVEFDKHVFILGTDRQTDIMMKKQLGKF